jgi:proton-dependent oligopeptide transporter, POT family
VSGGAKPERAWFGQPPGLTILFMTEMWEKFSFYGMRVLLVLYMTKALDFAQSKASLIYGLYTAFAYFFPIFGGLIADRWLGRRRSVIIGGAVMAAGHFMMAFPALFFPALTTIAVGNGLFLPNLPSQVRGLYRKDDPRFGSAYNIYYVGINLGAILSALVCPTLGEFYGWHWGFAAAGVGMCLGLIIYIVGGRWLPAETKGAERPSAERDAPTGARGTVSLLFAVGLAVVVFRGVYEQIGNTIVLWTDADVDRTVGGFPLLAGWFQSLNPALVFLLTPVLVALWTRQARKGHEPSPLAKMSAGALGLAGAYLLLVGASALADASGVKASWLWLTAFIVLMTAAELFILPVGLGLFARLAPKGYGGTTVAAWFFAGFAGNLLAGALGALWSQTSHEAFFGLMAAVAAASALMLRLLVGRARTAETAAA